MGDHNLTDIYHITNLSFHLEKNPTQHARIDYFIISNSMNDIIRKADIICGYRTDLSIITLEI